MMKLERFAYISSLIISMLVSSCVADMPSQVPTAQDQHQESTSQSPVLPTASLPPSSYSPDEVATLRSLRQVDDYPLYTMHFIGETSTVSGITQPRSAANLLAPQIYNHQSLLSNSTWGCSLFAALGDGSDRLFGRNFDWEFSPSLLLFTAPPGGYTSVSMVDIAYLGFTESNVQGLAELPLEELYRLLESPSWPFDGMNSEGLAIGMAAVPAGNMRHDPDKPTIDSLSIMREILDHAANVAQAVEIFEGYNVEMGDGPPLHYLIADVTGEAALVEFYQGEMHIIKNEEPYHLATNFMLSATGDPGGQCWRYDTIGSTLAVQDGRLSTRGAIQLLSAVSQGITQWSIVYDLNSLEVHVVAGQKYDWAHLFSLK